MGCVIIMNCREYGNKPYKVIVIHGGPGAIGSCAGICRGLSDEFGVIEIFQSKNSILELVNEMLDVIKSYKLNQVILIGHSWGAWLSFIFTSLHPEYVSKLILVGSGLFDTKYYPQLIKASKVKIMPDEQKHDIQLANLYSGNMKYNPYSYCLLPNLPEDTISFNEQQCNLLLNEIIPIRDSGELLSYSEKIICPVVAIHGRNDPHIAEGIKIPLEKHLPDFKMFILEKCGHEPWKEYYAKDEFFKILKNELQS